MELEKFLNENPQEKAKFEAKMQESFQAGKNEAHATFKALEPFFKTGAYPESIMAHGLKALSGEQSKDVFLAAVAAYDAAKEGLASAAAKTESESQPNVQNSMPDLNASTAAKSAEEIRAMAEKDKAGRQ